MYPAKKNKNKNNKGNRTRDTLVIHLYYILIKSKL